MACAAAVVGLGACSKDGDSLSLSSGSAGTDDVGDASAGETGDGGGDACGSCAAGGIVECDEMGTPIGNTSCGEQACVDGLGCVDCVPGKDTCNGNGIAVCNDDGTPGEPTSMCDTNAGMVCSNGSCVDACKAAAESPSNVGCVFWAADLPNVREATLGAQTPWGVAAANASDLTADIVIERNIAEVGQPESLFVVATETIAPGTIKTIQLPRAEVTGWKQGDPVSGGDPTNTAKTNNAFRITSTVPLVMYQFNAFTNDFSTDASLLIPENGLGQVHRVIGYPSSKPIQIPGFPLQGVPDYSFVTVIAVADQTEVRVRPTATTRSDMQSIPVSGPGETIVVNLNRWQTLNIAGEGIDNDLTGTVVESDKPVAVFTGTEGSVSPAIGLNVPEPPGGAAGSCCVDHLEEQVFPAESLGKDFVITRSPPRSSGSIKEPDEYRVLAVAEPATVTTNLPSPNDSFTIQPGESFDFYTNVDFIAQSTAPIQIGQILLSQEMTADVIGDPALTIFPPAEQWREIYVFLTPPTWTRNYFVIARPKGGGGGGDQPGSGDIKLDGSALPGTCEYTDIGQLNGVDYESIRCPVDEGSHKLESDIDFGLTMYGYGAAGSYAYAGGADVRPIYTVPPVP